MMKLTDIQSVTSSGIAMPLLALGGFALALAGWLAPLPSFQPGPASTDAISAGATGANTIEVPPPLEPDDWSSLRDPLNELRAAPPPEAVKDPEPETTPVIETTPPFVPPNPALSPLGWTYAGYASGDILYALIITADGHQKFVREGDVVEDLSGTVTIVAINPEELTLKRAGDVKETLPYTPGTTTAPGKGVVRVPGRPNARNIVPRQQVPTRRQ